MNEPDLGMLPPPENEPGTGGRRLAHGRLSAPRRRSHTLNTISGGFAGGGSTSSARKRYARGSGQELRIGTSKFDPGVITFSGEDAKEVLSHENDPMVIEVQIRDCGVKRVLI